MNISLKTCLFSSLSGSSLPKNNNNNILDPFFITGITDAEGTFACIIRKSAGHHLGPRTSVFMYSIRPPGHKLPLVLQPNYSTTSSSVVPVKIYNNMDLYKFQVVYENKGCAGIYRIINLTNNKIYVGSSVNLSRRFTSYYSFKHIDRWKTRIICKALIKYGYSNFQLDILEYCAPEKCIEREQYYFDMLKPEYNILKIAGSSLGYKHSEETLVKFRERKHSEETRAKISTTQIGRKFSEETKAKLRGRPRPVGSGTPSVHIEVFDQETGIKTIYLSMTEAAQALGTYKGSISKYFSTGSQKPFKGRYYLKKVDSGMNTGRS
jgi:group I intron endonuclease